MLVPYGRAQTESAEGTGAPDLSASAKPEDNACRLSGTVVNSVTGEPIRRAAVELLRPANNGQVGRATLTDNAGHFEFDGLPEGRAFLSVTKPGFFDGWGMPNGAAAGTAVQVARDASPMVLKMTPAGAIFGRVTTRDEQPLEGFQVRSIAKRNVNGQPAWFGQFQAITDENGNFRIAGLPAGMYYVAVDQSQETTLGQRGVPNAREQSYAKFYYPGVSEFNAATALELSAGREVEANFSLAAEPIYQVSGSVSAGEDPPSGLMFARKAGEDYDFTEGASVQEGKFQVGLPAGSYRVTGMGAGGVQFSTPGASVVVSSDSPDIRITLNPAMSIPVQVRTEHAGGTTEISLPLQGGMTGMYLQPVSVAFFQRPANFLRSLSSGIQNVEPGVYTVVINTGGPWWVKSAQCGGVDLLSDDLVVADGAQPPPIEVTLRDDAATVSGTVAPADEAEQSTVLLVQQHGRKNLVKVAGTAEGKFEVQGVAPGDYLLLALDHADQLEYANPEVLSPYLSQAQHISVQPHGTTNVNLSLSSLRR